MRIYMAITSKKESSIIRKIKSEKLGDISVSDLGQIIVTNNRITKSKEVQLVKKLENIEGVLDVVLINPHLKMKDVLTSEAFRSNQCIFFFDIDSTLTQGIPGTIHPKIEPIFQKMKNKGIHILFATGRSMPDLCEIIKEYPVSKYAIAENGGIILGFGRKSYYEFGHRAEPAKVLTYLQRKYQTREDMEQDIRLTEVIFLQSDVTRKQLNEAINKEDASVEIHASANAYHISEKGINKGTAMIELCKRAHLGDRMIISVGDSDMDIPMLEKAGYSFAVGNASPGAKKAAKKVLKGKFEKGIDEIFQLINRV